MTWPQNPNCKTTIKNPTWPVAGLSGREGLF